MTTGEPLVCPRRDEAAADADQAAALGRHRHARAGAGAARAHRLLHGARRGRRRRGDGRLRAGRRLPDEVRRRPHRRRRARRSTAYKARASGGNASLDRLHGRGQDDARPVRCDRGRASTPTRCSRRASAGRSPSVFAADGEAAFRAAEEEVVLEALDAPAAASSRSAAARCCSERVRAALAAHTVVFCRRRRRDGLAARRRGTARPLARDRERVRRALDASAGRSTSRWPTCSSPAPRGDCRRRLLRCCAPGRCGPGRAGARRAGRSSGRGRAGRARPAAGGASASPTATSPSCYGGALAGLAGLVEIPAGEEHKTLATAERVWRALAAQGVTRADHVVALGGGVVGDLAGFCAATYQRGDRRSCRCRRRSSRRSTRPTAARPASTCPRPRTTSAPTTSPRRCSPTPATLATLPARGARRRLRRGRQDRADRRRRAVGARGAPARRSTTT